MTRKRAKETLMELMRRVNSLDNGEKFEISMNEDEFLEDIGYALDFAIADMSTLQDVINDVSGIMNE